MAAPEGPTPTSYLIMLQGPINEEGGLLLHALGDGMGHCVVGLGAPGAILHAVLVVHVLLGRPETQRAENHPQISGRTDGEPSPAVRSIVY